MDPIDHGHVYPLGLRHARTGGGLPGCPLSKPLGTSLDAHLGTPLAPNLA